MVAIAEYDKELNVIIIEKANIMADKIYVEGFRSFLPHQKAPDFVLGELVISIDEFKNFINNNQNLLSEYKGKKQLKAQVLKGINGTLNFVVNDFKPQPKEPTHPVMQGSASSLDDGESPLPF